MKKFKYWFLSKMIDLCNYALRFSDGAEDQGDINEVVAMKNYFIKQRENLVDTDDLIEVIKVLRQTVMEVRHAQDQGSRWYTKGDIGLYMQVKLHLDKADIAIKSIKSTLDE